jgi:hypothetical protein
MAARIAKEGNENSQKHDSINSEPEENLSVPSSFLGVLYVKSLPFGRAKKLNTEDTEKRGGPGEFFVFFKS